MLYIPFEGTSEEGEYRKLYLISFGVSRMVRSFYDEFGLYTSSIFSVVKNIDDNISIK